MPPRKDYPDWFFRWLDWNADQGSKTSTDFPDLFDDDLSELSPSDWDCGCDSDDSDCEIQCLSPPVHPAPTSRSGQHSMADNYKFAHKVRERYKRSVRLEKKFAERTQKRETVFERKYYEIRLKKLSKMEAAIANIRKKSSVQPQKMPSVQDLREKEYNLISVTPHAKEHLAMTMYGSELSLEKCHIRGYTRTHLDAHLTLGNRVMSGTGDKPFLGPSEDGKMVVPMKSYHDLKVTFHSIDYIEVEIPMSIIRRYQWILSEREGGTRKFLRDRGTPESVDGGSGLPEYQTFYGVRSTQKRDAENEREKDRLERLPPPPPPPSP
ncbi:hypothetical protein CGCF415_v003942 [Colletotrichum fructicola]|nr:hypothetical protein CGCF415_v003942 [Colletotrichum fructicola]KAF4939403.1 hypothetical protein CGCF245_v003524 [Colletotrichum fructicola]KAF5504749.1 hypothetical protein CGCF413_v005613 [Colletotrichum fructicola]